MDPLTVTLTLINTAIALAAVVVAAYAVYASSIPEVGFYVDVDDDTGVTYLVLRNTGGSAAHDVRFPGFDFELIEEGAFRKYAKEGFLGVGLPSLPPGCTRRVIAMKRGSLKAGTGGLHTQVPVTYTRRGFLHRQQLVEETFFIDYRYLKGLLRTNSDAHLERLACEQIAKELKACRCSLEAMAEVQGARAGADWARAGNDQLV